MKLKTFLCVAMAFIVLSALTGCARVRTYTVEKDRVDQNLSTGNQGFMSGSDKESGAVGQRRLTRTTYVTEVEVGGVAKKNKAGVSRPRGMAVETVQEPASEPLEEASSVSVPTSTVSSYTVQNNDTLQKISLKVYGTSKKWKKIFEANADQLKSPDRIYAGQVLKIPER
ncbi:MAG: LysM peptidoglycan-binding domain-containing protein [Candidatus Omnitrophota bacterium]